MESDIQEALVGKEIESVEMDICGRTVCFHLKDAPSVVLEARGDCCSESWIESIDAPLALVGKVLSVEEIPMPFLGNVMTDKHSPVDPRQGQGCISYYGLKITTVAGTSVIDYRNDSNGYYGGELVVRKNNKEIAP